MKKIRFGIVLLILALTVSAGPTPGTPIFASQISGGQFRALPTPALATVGPTDATNGFPLYYRDSVGLALRLCLGDAVNCAFNDPPVTGNAFSQQIGFGANAYYFRARADLNVGRSGQAADFEASLKAGFKNGPPVNGEQIVSGRIRLRAIGLERNTAYVLTHPYGVDNITTDSNGNVEFSNEVGCLADEPVAPACDFARALPSRIGPFLTAVSPAPPAGFIGVPNPPQALLQTVTGSPFGTNFVRLEGINAGGDGVNTALQDRFQLQGQRINAPPIAVNDSATVAPNSANNTINVLANDSDPEGAAISVTAVTQGSNGGVVTSTSAAVVYTPASGFSGVETFTYTVSDGSQTATATVTVTVNRAPVAANDTVVVQSGSSNNPINVLTNDSDPDGRTISVTAVTQGVNGSVAVGPGASNVLYTPTAAFSGNDAFTYTISDGLLTASATVSVTVQAVNRAPVASNDSVAVPQNSTRNVLNALANDTDPDGNPLSITSLGTPLNGTAVLGHAGATAVYTPTLGFVGGDTFTYTISDGSLTATASIIITVTAGASNQAPVAASDAVTVTQNSASNSVNVLANDTDPNGNPTSITSVTQGTNGSVTIAPDATRVIYTPNPSFAGADTFTYTISDGSLTSTTTVTITVAAAATNQPPVAVNDSALVTQDSAVNVINVLANDSDPNGNPLTVTAVSTPVHGSAAVGPNGSHVHYTPTTGFTGADAFNYSISDGSIVVTGTVVVDVRRTANRSPAAANDTSAVTGGSANNRINVLANDSDPDGDSIRVTATSSAGNGTVTIGTGGANVLYTPSPTFGGVDSFTYTISDGSLTATGTVTVTTSGVRMFVPLLFKEDTSAF